MEMIGRRTDFRSPYLTRLDEEGKEERQRDGKREKEIRGKEREGEGKGAVNGKGDRMRDTNR